MDPARVEQLAGSIALDILRAHLGEVRAAASVPELRTRLRDPLRQASELFTRTTGAPPDAFEATFDRYAAQLVPMQDPAIDRFGRLYDAKRERPWLWAAGIGVVLLLALSSWFLQFRNRREPQGTDTAERRN